MVAQSRRDQTEAKVRFVHGDYRTDLGLETQPFDLLVSPYAGFISEHCSDYLRIGGKFFVSLSHDDAAMASSDCSSHQTRTDWHRSGRRLIPQRWLRVSVGPSTGLPKPPDGTGRSPVEIARTLYTPSQMKRIRRILGDGRTKGAGAAVAALLAAAGAIEGAWALASSDPLIPGLGAWLRGSARDLASLAAIAGLTFLAVSMMRTQLAIHEALRPVLGPPANADVMDYKIHAGADVKIELKNPVAASADRVKFSARQGGRIIVRSKSGEVDAESVGGPCIRLPLTLAETSKLQDGYLLLQADILRNDGTWTVTQQIAIEALGRLVD